MKCEKCQGPIARWTEGVLIEEERKVVQVAPGVLRVGLFKHADRYDCREPEGHP
jgi:hypothetical protein